MDSPETFLCLVEDVPSMRPIRIEKNGRGILVCKENSEFFAFDEYCPHKNLSMEHGVVLQGTLICPWHQYRFALDTGRCSRRRCAPATTIRIRRIGEEIHVVTAETTIETSQNGSEA